ncbi:MAG: flotillin-like protein FloA [Pirellulaceae bacterium]|nr:flotillin-like protein FloA [Pirellulaceae bacterium]
MNALLLAAEDTVFSPVLITSIAIAGAFALVVLIVLANYGSVWLRAYMSRANISIYSLIGMSFQQVDAKIIVNAKIMAVQAGLDAITTRRLSAHYLANGNVLRVIHAIIAAHRAGIDLDFDRAAAIDLAGRDVLDAVQTSVNPKVIPCPDPRQSGKSKLSAVAKDGIELRTTAKVTVRTNLEQLIGGATEDTVIARVGESIISSIGSSANHKEVLSEPGRITEAVLARGLDSQTAFEIVSIDIADIDVGENIGARLRLDQAEADTRVARAKAEQRRAEAIAAEQEQKAKVTSNRARLVLSEAAVPMAMADAFRKGNMGT